MFKKYRLTRLIVGFCLVNLGFGSATVMAAMSEKHCEALAETDYENIYCQVKYKGLGKNLPDFDEFRQSQEWIQASLLKKPAKEAYIALPKPKKHKKRVDAYWWKKPVKESAVIQNAAKTNQSSPVVQRPAQTRAVAKQTAPCRYSLEQIVCKQKRWQLQKNERNNTLRKGVLSDSNTMQMAKQNAQGDNQYLTAVYPVYLKKMLDIGLGGSTMAYTRFVRVYEEGKKQGLIFNERFEKMYTLLKKERQVMGVSNKLPKDFIPSVTSCFVWQADLMTCDNNRNNLIYIPN